MKYVLMKPFLTLAAVALACMTACGGDPIRKAVADQLRQYPASRVQDIYKNFCQDNLGPGHLVANPEAARAYLMSELETYREELAAGLYKKPELRFLPVGDKGNYIRVDLSVVLDGMISAEDLLDALVRSTNDGPKATEEAWIAKWNSVAAVLRRDFPDIPDASRDLAEIDSLVAQGHLVLHHSDAFSQAYNPHYRIISRDILASGPLAGKW